MSVDTIGNFLTIIRNGIRASKPHVSAPHSRMRVNIANILKLEGFIGDYAIEGEGHKKDIKVFLKYVDGESVVHEISRVSTPGRRKYESAVKLRPVIGGLGVSIVTTNQGVMTNKEAKQRGIGGEVMCSVW
jgi:small subunit ribosomal protein S8